MMFLSSGIKMKSEIKNGLFTSTQVSMLLGMKVQTLREWQRKNYLQLPDTGGWQRYSIPEIVTLSAMEKILSTGVTHELAASIARFASPVLEGFLAKNDGEIPLFYLLVSVNPDHNPTFELIEDMEKVCERLSAKSTPTETYVTRLLIDFKDIYLATFESLSRHVIHDGSRMIWKPEGDKDQ